MPLSKNKGASWSVLRQHLKTWEKPALIALLKELYGAAPVNRDFLQVRCLQPDEGGAVLEKYRKQIVVQFFPARGFGKLKLGDARKAIREYRKVTGDVLGTADLLLSYVENGARFTAQYGDIDARFYSSLESALTELAELFRGAARSAYPLLRERLEAVEPLANRVGWGFGDFVSEVVEALAEEFDEM